MGKNNGKNVTPVSTATVTPEAIPAKKKWFEEAGGFGFDKEDIVYIGLGHPNGVADRFALVLEASEKPNHIKAQMQNPKTGELQRSVVVIDNAHLVLVAKGYQGAPVLMELGDAFSIDKSGIYKTKAQVEKELSKEKNKPAETATTEPTEEELAQAQ